MNESREPDHEVDAGTAVLHVLLQETFTAPLSGESAVRAEWMSADVAAAAAKLAHAERVAGHGADPAARRTWLVAAFVLLGAGVLFAVALLQSRGGDAAAQEPKDPAIDEVPVRDLDHLRELLPLVASVRLEAQWLADPDLPHVDVSGAPVGATDDWTRDFVRALRDEARVERPAGWKWQNRLTLVLGDGRQIVMAIDTYDRSESQTLGVRGLRGDLVVGPAGAAAARELLATATRVARLAHGVVTSAADLAGPSAFPATLEELRLFNVGGDDLAHLARFGKLRRLDASGVRGPFGANVMRHVAKCTVLEELLLDDCSLDDGALGVLSRTAAPLRTLSVRDNDKVTAAGLAAVLDVKTLRKIDIRGIDGLDLEALSIAAFLHPDVEWVR